MQVQERASEHLRRHDGGPRKLEECHHPWRERYGHDGEADLDEQRYCGI